MKGERRGHENGHAQTKQVFRSFADWEKCYFPNGIDGESNSGTSDPEQYAAELAEKSLRQLGKCGE